MYRPKTSLTLMLASAFLLILAACGTAGPVDYDDSKAVSNDASEATVDSSLADEPEGKAEQDMAISDSSPTVQPRPESDIDLQESETDANNLQVGFTEDGHAYRGDPNAPVVIEEFSDFQCPFCGRFSEQTLSSLDENQIALGEVLLIYYDFPLESIHPQAFAAANAARCAGDQGPAAYWNMHDKLFSGMQDWSGQDPLAVFRQYAEELDLDLGEFTSCVESNKFKEQIEADIALATSRGVRSTPSFFLNGQSLVGAQPVEVFNEAIAAIQDGESIATAPEEPPVDESPLQAPRVAPTPAAIRSDDAAGSLGDPDAPVTIVEYTDYQCPFCQRHVQETMPGILSDMIDTGRVHYVLKDLPLDRLHPEARAAAQAARCAGEQDGYWEMHDALFEAQPSWAGQGEAAADTFISLANELDLDEAAFRACLEEERYAEVIQANVDEASALGANATPYFFIDGLPIPGAQPYELFLYAVGLAEEGLLAEAFGPGEPDISKAYGIGDPNAPVVIIEYTDFQCPFCSRHYEQTFGQIKENFVDSGDVYYIFKDFPLTNIHPQAVMAAEAARCAGDQENYVAMHGKLFETQAEWQGRSDAVDLFIGYAGELGLDAESFASCVESGEHEAAVMQDLEEGSQLGVTGTPAFFINGHSMSGAQPYPIFEQAIKQFLSG
jgi:protein-disulfide isomerase